MKRTNIAVLLLSVIVMLIGCAKNAVLKDGAKSSSDGTQKLNSVTLPQTDELSSKKSGDKYGFVDKTGKFVIAPQFKNTNLDGFSQGLAAVESSGDKWGYIDSTGKFVIEPQFEDARAFSEGTAVVLVGDKYGFVDKTGKFVIEPQFRYAHQFSEGLAAVRDFDTKKDGYIDGTGKFVIKPRFEDAQEFSEGLAAVTIKEEGKYGFIDKTGKFVIKPQFTDYGYFSEGLAAVRGPHTEDEGYIDRTGRFVIEPQFSMAGRFKDGQAEVHPYPGKEETIDKTGRVISSGYSKWYTESDRARENEFVKELICPNGTEADGVTCKDKPVDVRIVQPQVHHLCHDANGHPFDCETGNPLL
jgi:WG containing repeat